MKKNLALRLLAACLGLSAFGASAAVITSTFDVDAEDWGTGRIKLGVDPLPDKTVFDRVNYDAAGHMIQSFDIHDWNTFRSSPAYAGNKSAFFGGSISYDLQDTQSDPGVPWPNIGILSGSGALIFIQTLPPDSTSLTHYEFVLDSSAGWLKTPFSFASLRFPTASDDDIKAVLGDVVGIWINADWKTGDSLGNDDARLDNVCLRDRASSCTAPVPAPGTLALMSLGIGLLGVSRLFFCAGSCLRRWRAQTGARS